MGTEATTNATADTAQKLAVLALARAAGAAQKASSEAYSFVLQPGGTAAKNVYTSMAALYAVAGLVAGGVRCTIDTSHGAAHVTASAQSYNFNEWTFVPYAPETSPVQLIVDAGVTLASDALTIVDGPLEILSQAAAPLQSPGNGQIAAWSCRNGGQIAASAVSPWFAPTGTGIGFLQLVNGTLGDGANPLGGAGVHVQAFDKSNVQAGSINGTASVQYDATSTIGALVGTVVKQMADVASLVAFTPAVPANWGTSPPTQTAAAADDLALPFGVRNAFNAAGVAAGASPQNVVDTAYTILNPRSKGIAVDVVYNATLSVPGTLVSVQILRDGGGIGNGQVPEAGASSGNISGTLAVYDEPGPGAHTYSVQFTWSGVATLTTVPGAILYRYVEVASKNN